MTAIWPAVLVTAYFVVTGCIMAVRSGATGALGVHLVMLALLATTLWRRAPSWARDWAPIFAIPVMYVELPAVIGSPDPTAMFDALVVGWEQALFGGQPSGALAARWPSVWLSEPLHAAYVAYYPIIVSVPFLVRAFRTRAQFHEAVFVLLFTFTVCFLWFVGFPVAGPYYSGMAGTPDGPMRSATRWLLDGAASRGTAFPSSHVAVTATQCVLMWRYFGARGALLIPLGIALAFGAVYGGFHYAVDAIAGAALGVLLAVIGLRIARLAEGGAAQANATAPT